MYVEYIVLAAVFYQKVENKKFTSQTVGISKIGDRNDDRVSQQQLANLKHGIIKDF